MRFVIALVLGGALALSGCGSDSEGSGGSGGMNGGEAPVITMVEWAPVGGCTPGMASDFTVTVTATDADSDALMYDGSVTRCSGSLDAMTSTINCPNANPYAGSVVVSDGDGNDSAPFNFSIGVCETSSAP